MQTLKEEIPQQLIKEHSARVYKCEGANEFSVSGSSSSRGSCDISKMCPVMSWLLCLYLWVSVTAIQLCQATFYDTIQQHHGMRPGRTTIHMI
ncbi:hypothetical protein FQN60_001717, partial [Etheostoma spectabile]